MAVANVSVLLGDFSSYPLCEELLLRGCGHAAVSADRWIICAVFLCISVLCPDHDFGPDVEPHQRSALCTQEPQHRASGKKKNTFF